MATELVQPKAKVQQPSASMEALTGTAMLAQVSRSTKLIRKVTEQTNRITHRYHGVIATAGSAADCGMLSPLAFRAPAGRPLFVAADA